MTQNPDKLRFRNMSDADKLAIINAPVRERFAGGQTWRTADLHAIFFGDIYRIPVTQDTTYWPLLDKRWRWQARDENGRVWVYGDKPVLMDQCWIADLGHRRIDDLYPDFKPGTCHWRDSLQERPEDDQ